MLKIVEDVKGIKDIEDPQKIVNSERDVCILEGLDEKSSVE